MAATPWRTVGAAVAGLSTATTANALIRQAKSKWRIAIPIEGLRDLSGNTLLTNSSIVVGIFSSLHYRRIVRISSVRPTVNQFRSRHSTNARAVYQSPRGLAWPAQLHTWQNKWQQLHAISLARLTGLNARP